MDDPSGPWSSACWRSLAELVVDIAGRREIPLEREHVPTHSDVHPLARTSASGRAWDTVAEQWSWGRFEQERALLISKPKVDEQAPP